MPGTVYIPLVPSAPHEWQIPYDSYQHNMMPLQNVMNPMPTTPHGQPQQPQLPPPEPSPYLSPVHHQPPPPPPQHHRYRQEPPTPTIPHSASAPWSPTDDDVLVKARTRNMAWGTIRDKHFPTKTANACRKRYERLMVKRRGNDWDEDRTARLAVAYKEMREATWSPLAENLGERWEHVEKACMEKGLTNILNLASSHSRTSSNRHSKVSTNSDNERYARDRAEREDSGIAFAGESSSRRSSHSNGGSMPNWQQQILQPPRHHQ